MVKSDKILHLFKKKLVILSICHRRIGLFINSFKALLSRHLRIERFHLFHGHFIFKFPIFFISELVAAQNTFCGVGFYFACFSLSLKFELNLIITLFFLLWAQDLRFTVICIFRLKNWFIDFMQNNTNIALFISLKLINSPQLPF